MMWDRDDVLPVSVLREMKIRDMWDRDDVLPVSVPWEMRQVRDDVE